MASPTGKIEMVFGDRSEATFEIENDWPKGIALRASLVRGYYGQKRVHYPTAMSHLWTADPNDEAYV